MLDIELAGHGEADAWERDEHMGLELRRKKIFLQTWSVVIT